MRDGLRQVRGRQLQFLAFALAVLISVGVLVFARGTVASSDSAGRAVSGADSSQALRLGMVMLVPVALTLLPLVVPRKTRGAMSIASVSLFGVWLGLTSATVGYFFLPSFAAAAVALFMTRSRRTRSATEQSSAR